MTGEVEHRLGHAHREVRRGLGVAVERASRVERERRARGDREVRRRATERRRDHRRHAQVWLARERNIVTAEAGAGQRILVGVHAGDHAEAHRLLRAVEADVTARDDARFHQTFGAGGDALEQRADVHHALHAQRVREEALDQRVDDRRQQILERVRDCIEEARDQVSEAREDAAAGEVEVELERVDAREVNVELAVGGLDAERNVEAAVQVVRADAEVAGVDVDAEGKELEVDGRVDRRR